MNNPQVYTDTFLDAVRSNSGEFILSRTIWEQNNRFIKCYLGDPVILPSNVRYFNTVYGGVEAGISAVVDIINTLDPGLIEYWAYRDNYYMEFHSPKVNKSYELHSQELIATVGDIESYVKYFISIVQSRKSILGDLFFTDYHRENVFVQSDLSWICVDYDGIFCYGTDMTSDFTWDRIRYKFLGSHDLTKHYEKEYLQELWTNYV